jgi:hypothetical protein
VRQRHDEKSFEFMQFFRVGTRIALYLDKKNTHIAWGESRSKNNKSGFIAQNNNGFAHGR